MGYDQLVKTVREKLQLGNDEQAVRAIEATLRTLSERLAGREASQLAAQLPVEFRGAVKEAIDKAGEPFSMDEFYQRVRKRESIDQMNLAAAIQHAQTVMALICQTVTPGEVADVRAQLPPEYNDLFSQVQTSPTNQGSSTQPGNQA
ncbi:MAG TPA: DUF2267 domain-containing protein [Chloroflexia bacterium]|nr:DUF2267 domain-containing protein [Chloroflexia bacterium]